MIETPYVDLVFPLGGKSLPLDNGYLVYSALSHICPTLHELENISIHPISGIPQPNKQLCLTNRSKLQIRIQIEQIPLIDFIGNKSKNRLSFLLRKAFGYLSHQTLKSLYR